MDAILRVCSDNWKRCDGSGLSPERALSKAEFMKDLQNNYAMHVNPVHEIRAYRLNASGIKVTVHVSAQYKPSSVTVKLLKASIASLTRMFGPAKYKEFTLILVQSNEDKVSDGPLTKRKINTGFSMGNTIVVYRCQEMHKVLVHELLHFWGTHDNIVDGYASELVHRLGAPQNCLLYESYVETVATIMMCGFCTKSGTPRERLQKEIIQSYKSAKQVVSVEQHDTNVWAYYVARACLFACVVDLSGWLSTASGFTRKLKGTQAWKSYSHIIEKGMKKLGGPSLTKLAASKNKSMVLRSCDCNLGPSFSH